MKYVYQFGIILAVTIAGEFLYKFIHLPIPASIYGLLIMLVCLKTKIIKLGQIKETSSFLIIIMPLMFIPAGVGVITTWKELSSILLPAIVITLVTTLVVMVVTGKVAQFIIGIIGEN